jgi:hypothetical protein
VKNHCFFSTASLLIVLFTHCSKDAQNSSKGVESNVETPVIILGKWELIKEDDTTFYRNNVKCASWELRDWYYNFNDDNILLIGNGQFVDSFTYKFVDKDCIKIGWPGTPLDPHVDTIVKLTKSDLVIKHWITNEDHTRTKQVSYLSK